MILSISILWQTVINVCTRWWKIRVNLWLRNGSSLFLPSYRSFLNLIEETETHIGILLFFLGLLLLLLLLGSGGGTSSGGGRGSGGSGGGTTTRVGDQVVEVLASEGTSEDAGPVGLEGDAGGVEESGDLVGLGRFRGWSRLDLENMMIKSWERDEILVKKRSQIYKRWIGIRIGLCWSPSQKIMRKWWKMKIK